jgi:hypothetical protein
LTPDVKHNMKMNMPVEKRKEDKRKNTGNV